MSPPAEIPMAVAVLVSLALLAGAVLALVGAIGLATLRGFYQRVHAPTLASTMGMFLILTSSIVYVSVSRGSLVFHEVLIAVFLTLTTPISLMLVVRAALARDRFEGSTDVPPLDASSAD
jgi:multicomponent K+:H+ antiporter subunit G